MSAQHGAEGTAKMRLSEAIRLGAMLRPQAFGQFYADGATCAFGAALDAVGRLYPLDSAQCFIAITAQGWDDIQYLRIACPECGRSAAYTVQHLNNLHKWTRERIADWLEGIEQEHTHAAATDTTVGQIHEVRDKDGLVLALDRSTR